MLAELCSGKYLQRISHDLIEVLIKPKKKIDIPGTSLLLLWCITITPTYSAVSWYYGLYVLPGNLLVKL
jgi:hypothetical protein